MQISILGLDKVEQCLLSMGELIHWILQLVIELPSSVYICTTGLWYSRLLTGRGLDQIVEQCSLSMGEVQGLTPDSSIIVPQQSSTCPCLEQVIPV